MAALLQSFPQPTNTMSILQSRPSSASGILSTKPHNQVSRHSNNNKMHMQRNSFSGINSAIPISNYPGQSFSASIAPYAFTSTPELNTLGYSTTTFKESGANAKPLSKTYKNNTSVLPSEYEYRTNVINEASNTPFLSLRSTNGHKAIPVDESVPSTPRSTISSSNPSGSSNSSQNLSFISTPNTSKSPPGRYRRTYSQSIDLSNNSSLAVFQTSVNEQEPLSICNFKDFSLQMPQLTDFSLDISSGERNTTIKNSLSSQPDHRYLKNGRDQNETSLSLNSSNRPYSSHKRDESSEGKKSAYANNPKSSQALQDERLTTKKHNSCHESLNSISINENSKSKAETTGPTNGHLRISSNDAVKRVFNPSPLSNPVTINLESTTTKNSFASAVNTALQHPSGPKPSSPITAENSSPAAIHLTALKKKDGKKRKNFRLRRAFSFGSAAELRNASSAIIPDYGTSSTTTGKKESVNQDGLDAEQIRIVQQQEAGGIGTEIYTGQGNIFSGSNDNLSISSTASSASIMIRKMGKGMKKSTRSIVGLFRPKNTAGSSSELSTPAVGETHVSIVNVEAERVVLDQGKNSIQKESKSLDLGRSGISCSETFNTSRNILGGEKDHAEALTVGKKGILKRTGLGPDNTLTIITPRIPSTSVFQGPQITAGNDTPTSTAPSTPKDDQKGDSGHDSTTYVNEDYFASALRLQGSPRSQPATPSFSGKRNTKFSPSIQFHDTWPSGEYDRRGEIATCNRLTPMLAQQIKEELNTFKMEMEVHENSKIYTHFF